MSKKLVILRGLGGNFKTSILKSSIFKDFIRVSEGNRLYESKLEEFGRKTDTAQNFCVKHTLLVSQMDSEKDLILDRGLLDYAVMNQIVLDYSKEESIFLSAYEPLLTEEYCIKEESQLFKDHEVVNILLATYDRDFLHKIIDESFDARGSFFGDTDTYLEKQDLYISVMRKYLSNMHEIRFDHVPEDQESLLKLIDDTTAQIQKLLC